MSDVARIYVAPKRPGGQRFRRFRRMNLRKRGKFFGSVVLAVAALAGLWFLWATRASYPMERLLPSDQKFHVFFSGLLAKRETIANSQAWSLAPEGSAAAKMPDLLRNSFGMPDWVINNVAYGDCHVSGRDVLRFSDLLFVTQMSRLGCLAERFHRFVGVVDDHAGGLDLRFVPDAAVFYAVRGRVLVASPSREAVVRALTLREDDALSREDLARGLAEAGNADVYGRFSLSPDDPFGAVFSIVRMQMHFEETGVHAAFRAVLGEPWRARLSGVLAKAAPTALLAPPPGLLEISGNFGNTFGDLVHGLARSFDQSGRTDGLLSEWTSPGAEGVAPGAIVGALLNSAGPGWRVCWRGVDANEMVPVPEVLGTFDMTGVSVPDLFGLLPAPPENANVWEPYPRRDEEKGLVYIPAIGGPSLTPAAAPYGSALLVSSSRAVAESVLASAPVQSEIAEKGNLFIRVRPATACKAIVDAGAVLARNGLLRGYSADTFKNAAALWQTAADRVSEVTALGAHQDGEVSLSLRVNMAPPA